MISKWDSREVSPLRSKIASENYKKAKMVENMVDERFKALGHSVKRMIPDAPFDILVNDDCRVEVKYTKYERSREYYLRWVVKNVHLDKFDMLVVALHFSDETIGTFWIPERKILKRLTKIQRRNLTTLSIRYDYLHKYLLPL